MIASLSSDDHASRQAAREALEAIGPDAVKALIRELDGLDDEARGAALKALGRIGAPEAIPALIRELEDEDSGCRWQAAEALASIGDAVLVPLLRLLADGAGSVYLRRGIHHVLHSLERSDPKLLSPVLQAFQSDVPEIAIPGAAGAALVALEG